MSAGIDTGNDRKGGLHSGVAASTPSSSSLSPLHPHRSPTMVGNGTGMGIGMPDKHDRDEDEDEDDTVRRRTGGRGGRRGGGGDDGAMGDLSGRPGRRAGYGHRPGSNTSFVHGKPEAAQSARALTDGVGPAAALVRAGVSMVCSDYRVRCRSKEAAKAARRQFGLSLSTPLGRKDGSRGPRVVLVAATGAGGGGEGSGGLSESGVLRWRADEEAGSGGGKAAKG